MATSPQKHTANKTPEIRTMPLTAKSKCSNRPAPTSSAANGGQRQCKNQDSQHSSRHPDAAARTSGKATITQALQPSATEPEGSYDTSDIRPSCLPEPVSFSISCRCGTRNKTATATGFNGTPRPRMTSLEAHSSSRKPGTVTSNNSGKRRT